MFTNRTIVTQFAVLIKLGLSSLGKDVLVYYHLKLEF